jgi:molybdopterin molybdotransferase
LQQILTRAAPAEGGQSIGLEDAVGRVLKETIRAPLDLPPFDSSAMDGYALLSTSLQGKPPYSMTLIGESLAGHPYLGTLGPGQCIRITTGAEVPEVTDTVVIQEHCERDGTRVLIGDAAPVGQNIRSRGHDVGQGGVIVAAGKRLNPFDIGWLAACGITHIPCTARPRVAVFSTGDELKKPGQELIGGQIYDANRHALLALLGLLPVQVTDLGILPDDFDSIRNAMKEAAREHDLLLTSGGVSVGDADFVRDVVEEVGKIDLWRLNLKPGKPLAFGNIDRALFLGLPGNPVSTIVTYLLIAQPLLLQLAGAEAKPPQTYAALLTTPISHNPGREEYQRGIISQKSGCNWVSVSGDQSSNRLATFSNADCLIRIGKDAGDLEQGEEVEVLPFSGLAF